MDSDLDPNAFLQSVRELKEKRLKEDNERYEQLQAQILRDRELRQARKLERERSLSPEKTPPPNASPAAANNNVNNNTPPPTTTTTTAAAAAPSSTPLTPTTHTHSSSSSFSSSPRNSSSMSRDSRESSAPLDGPTGASRPSPSSVMPTRSNTLSWQQRRPTSSSGRPRPLSAIASDNLAARLSPKPVSEDKADVSGERKVSREQIAESLASKDPAWFRQTADRGRHSPAYRSSRDGAVQEKTGAVKHSLPGMAKETDPVSDNNAGGSSPPPEPALPNPTSRITSVRGSTTWNSRPTSMASISELRRSDAKSPLPSLDSQKFPLPTSDRPPTADGEAPVLGRTMSTAQTRLTSDRPASPTKGMGGFVQSAMLKRTDSVNKRWSAQPTSSLVRNDSTASVRGAVGPIGGLRDSASNPVASRSMPRLDQLPNSSDSHSRPGSSHSPVSNLALNTDVAVRDISSRPSTSHHSRSRSVASLATPAGLCSPPLSPSKRWSPTKASWLESALSRPESPKPSQHSAQPSWMADITRAKQQRSNGEHTLSQDTLDIAEAQSLSNNPRTSISSFRNVTPPTKAKPAALVGRPTSLNSVSSDRHEEKEPMPAQANAPAPEASSATPQDSSPATPADLSSPFASPKPSAAGARNSASTASPKSPSVPALKPKPTTPPKRDFRSGLKSRSDATNTRSMEEPEFKAMFGKLRKTHTEKFVAPDELKKNIVRGKAGLSVSMGPQKSERRDELRDSLIKKKEEIKTKVVAAEPSDQKISPVPSAAIPEALRIKKSLGRPTGSLNIPERQRRDITPEALALHKALRGKPKAPSPERPALSKDQPDTSESADIVSLPEQSVDPKDVSTSAKPEVLQSKPEISPLDTLLTKSEPTVSPPPVNKFADRINPALASILARGPPVQPSASPTPRSGTPLSPQSSDSKPETGPGGQLTHMTKNRAKGPKRRKPNAKGAAGETTISKQMQSAPTIKSLPLPKPAADIAEPSLNFVEQSTSQSAAEPDSTAPEQKIQDPSISVNAAGPLTPIKLSSSSVRSSSGGPGPSASVPDAVPAKTHQIQLVGADKENQTSSVKNAAAMWGRTTQRVLSDQRSAPIQLPTKKDEEAALRSAGMLSKSPLRYTGSPTHGLGIIQSPSMGTPQRSQSGIPPTSPSPAVAQPPRPMKSSRVVSANLASKDLPSLPDPRTTKAGRLLAEYFGDIPTTTHELLVDTQEIIATRKDQADKLKTLRSNIQEIGADGSLNPMPLQGDHILYEDSMYVCTHIFGSETGTKTIEVYLWVGSGCSESSVRDAEVIAKRVAKTAAGGQRSTLYIVDQNKEPSAFFQALGGIVIVRRGSRTTVSTNPYLLCGRPHMGHIAFDEMDLSKASLCSDFPYIIARPVTLQETKVYLWRGKACAADAIGSARLIGMDLSPSGEIMEVEEGQEPRDLLLLMSDLRSEICSSPELWNRPKRHCEHSAARLFCIETAPPKTGAGYLFSTLLGRRPSWNPSRSSPTPQANGSPTGQELDVVIKEIAPYTQDDLEPEGCFVMDCDSTILVLPGPLLAKQPNYRHIFTQALLFAHDLSLVSVTLDDRPAIPVAQVVLAGLPRDAQLRFRRWDKTRGVWGAGGIMAGRRMDGLAECDILDIREALELCCRR